MLEKGGNIRYNIRSLSYLLLVATAPLCVSAWYAGIQALMHVAIGRFLGGKLGLLTRPILVNSVCFSKT